MRRELRPFGVQTVSIEPGPIATAIWEKGLKQKDEMVVSEDLLPFYGEKLKKFERATKKVAETAVPVERVTQVILHALQIPHPKARYVVGRKTLPLEMLTLRALPDRLADWMIRKQF